jgi:hypothetical protein
MYDVLIDDDDDNDDDNVNNMFRTVLWVILPCEMIVDGSITQKTALNIILAAVRT